MTDSYGYLLFKAFFSFAAVLALLGVFLYALKLVMKKTGMRPSDAGVPIKVLTVFPLEHRKNLTVVDVAGTVIVLGVTPSSVNMVARVESVEAAEELRRLGATRGQGLNRFFR